jgi:glutamate dehydrogenase
MFYLNLFSALHRHYVEYEVALGQLSRKEDLGAWRQQHATTIDRLRRLLATISLQAADLAPVSVALRELRQLA